MRATDTAPSPWPEACRLKTPTQAKTEGQGPPPDCHPDWHFAIDGSLKQSDFHKCKMPPKRKGANSCNSQPRTGDPTLRTRGRKIRAGHAPHGEPSPTHQMERAENQRGLCTCECGTHTDQKAKKQHPIFSTSFPNHQADIPPARPKTSQANTPINFSAALSVPSG